MFWNPDDAILSEPNKLIKYTNFTKRHGIWLVNLSNRKLSNLSCVADLAGVLDGEFWLLLSDRELPREEKSTGRSAQVEAAPDHAPCRAIQLSRNYANRPDMNSIQQCISISNQINIETNVFNPKVSLFWAQNCIRQRENCGKMNSSNSCQKIK